MGEKFLQYEVPVKINDSIWYLSMRSLKWYFCYLLIRQNRKKTTGFCFMSHQNNCKRFEFFKQSFEFLQHEALFFTLIISLMTLFVVWLCKQRRILEATFCFFFQGFTVFQLCQSCLLIQRYMWFQRFQKSRGRLFSRDIKW